MNPERFFAVRDEAGALDRLLLLRAERTTCSSTASACAPTSTGRGLGLDFFRAGPRVRARALPAALVRLYVAAFNERAIKVYERAGFRETGRHVRTFERWGDVEFVDDGRAALIEIAPEVREARRGRRARDDARRARLSARRGRRGRPRVGARVREAGAMPATIGVLDGSVRVGLTRGRARALRRVRVARSGRATSRRPPCRAPSARRPSAARSPSAAPRASP